jgi:hypothetical protein
MQLLTSTDTPADSPLKGRSDRLDQAVFAVFDAARRGLVQRLGDLRSALQRQVRANSLIHLRNGRVSVGVDVGDIGLGRIEPADVGA